MHPGNKGKGTELLDKICMNRVAKVRQTKTITKAVKEKKELSEAKKAHLVKLHEAKKGQFEPGENRKVKEEENIPEVEDDNTEDSPSDEVLTKKERELRNDMLWVLKKLGGRNKLLKMAKKSESLQVVIWKELLKLEGKMMEARIRSKAPAGQAQNGFFFVIKGLEDTKKVQGLIGNFDAKSLGNILAPEGDVIDMEAQGN